MPPSEAPEPTLDSGDEMPPSSAPALSPSSNDETSPGPLYQLQAQVQLVGITAAQFRTIYEMEFRMAIATLLGLPLDDILVLDVSDVALPVAQNVARKLQDSAQTALNVDFIIQVIETQAAAEDLSTHLPSSVNDGSLDIVFGAIGEPS